MVNEFATARRNPSLTSENGQWPLWGNRAGSQIFVPENQQLVAAGYGYHISVGALTTPIVGGGNGTILDADQPELVISVPSGTAIRPIRIHVQTEVPADTDGDVEEILIAVDRLAVSNASSSTGTVETAFNMRTDNPRSSNCTVVSANTSNITAPTLGLELARKQTVTNIVTSGITQGIFELLYEPKRAPLLVGPCALYVYWGGTAALSGFAQVDYIELPEDIDGLWTD